MLLVEKYRKEAETLRTQLAKANERVKELEEELTQMKADKGSYTLTKEQYEQLRKEQERC